MPDAAPRRPRRLAWIAGLLAAPLLWAVLPRDPDLPALAGTERTVHVLPFAITGRAPEYVVDFSPSKAKPLPHTETIAALDRDLVRQGFRRTKRTPSLTVWVRGESTVTLFFGAPIPAYSEEVSVELTRPANALERAADWLGNLTRPAP